MRPCAALVGEPCFDVWSIYVTRFSSHVRHLPGLVIINPTHIVTAVCGHEKKTPLDRTWVRGWKTALSKLTNLRAVTWLYWPWSVQQRATTERISAFFAIVGVYAPNVVFMNLSHAPIWSRMSSEQVRKTWHSQCGAHWSEMEPVTSIHALDECTGNLDGALARILFTVHSVQ